MTLHTHANRENVRRANENYVRSSKLIDVVNPSVYKNQSCFIIGGGPSLKDFDFSHLDHKITIGINKSFLTYNSTFLYIADINFYQNCIKEYSDKWSQFKGIKILLSPTIINNFESSTHLIRRTYNKQLSTLNDGINSYSNTGCSAIALAYVMGFKTVYLLGIDMACDTTTHWHDGYAQQTLIGQQNKMKSYVSSFNVLAEHLKKTQCQVINLNIKSQLECFKKQEYKW